MKRRRWPVLLFLALWAHPSSGGDLLLPAYVTRERFETETAWSALASLPAGRRPRVVLVMGGGGARGLTHIGVLRVLEQERIPVDAIVGVSVGALIGALYASGLSVDKIQSMSQEVGWENLTDYSRIRALRLLLSDDLLSTDKMENYLKRHIGNMFFTDLKIPFACVATDIRTGEKVVFKEGPVAFAARASATIPGVFAPVPYRQRSLVDGGLVDNLPTELLAEGDNDFVIAVLPKASGSAAEADTVLKALIRSLEIQKDALLLERRKGADWIIEPDVGSVSMMDLARSADCIDAGLLATRAHALAIKQEILRRVNRGKT